MKLRKPEWRGQASKKQRFEIDPKTVQRVLDLIPRAESFVFTGGHGGGGFIVDELNNIFTDFLNKNLN